MRRALATLPWVEQRSIEADRSTKTVRFGINAKDKYDLEELKQALPSRYRRGVAVIEGPTAVK